MRSWGVVVLVVGCVAACGGNDVMVIAGSGTGGEGGNGGALSVAVGVGGMNGSGGAGGDETAVGGHGGAATGQGGDGAGGQSPTVCPAPECLGDDGVDCGSDCGAAHSACNDGWVCKDGSYALGYGTTRVRLPAVNEPTKGCCATSSPRPWQVASFYVGFVGPNCVSVTAPSAARVQIATVTPGHPRPDKCDAWNDGAEGCAVASIPEGQYAVITVALPEPVNGDWPINGSEVAFTVLQSDDCKLDCSGGCNGSGDQVAL